MHFWDWRKGFFFLGLAWALPHTALGTPMIETKDVTLDLGVLAQPAFQSLGQPDSSATSQDFFLRRARLIAGGTVGSSFEFFLETDAPNLGLDTGNPPTKNITPSIFLQDFYVSYHSSDAFHVDAGLIYIPFLHNGLQGASTLYSWDYFANTFNQSAPLSNINGRDTGVQARGLIANHVEYRVGVFQGRRTGIGQNSPRYAGRVQVNLLDPETEYFYAGTYFGAKRIVSFGIGFDAQDTYRGYGADAFVDLPVGGGVVTAQIDCASLDPGTFLSTLSKQVFLSSEGGYRLPELPVSPILRFERRWMDTPTAAVNNETRAGVGVGYWIDGHRSNLKLFYTRVIPDTSVDSSAAAYNAVNLQWQLWFFR
jgi:hypothetical protein